MDVILLSWLEGSISKHQENCIRRTRIDLQPDFLGLYAVKYGLIEAKRDALRMISILKQESKKLINEADWIGESMKSKANDKIDSISALVAYDDEYLDENLTGRFFSNIDFDQKHFNKLSAQVSLTNSLGPISTMTILSSDSITASAYYITGTNQIVVFGPILAGVFYNPFRPWLVNFGTLGWIIAHEMAHAFSPDNMCFNRSDSDIEDQTESAYRNRTKCLIDLYDGRKLGGVDAQLNGLGTLNENFPDIIATKLISRVFSSEGKARDESLDQLIEGFDTQQLYWLSLANALCGDLRSIAVEKQFDVKTHSPTYFRVNVPFANTREFSNAFQCPVGTVMNPKQRCEFS